MRRNTEQMIQDSIERGYIFLEEGYGKQDEERLNVIRKAGYDVKAWYVPSDVEGTKKYVVYGRVRVRRTRPKVNIYSANITVKELREICKEKKVPKYYKMSRDEMIQSLQSV